MSEAFTVRPYEPGDETGILELFNRVFSEDNPAFEPRTMETWRHVYGENPAGVQAFVALDGEGRVIANYASIPAACVVRGERRMSTQAVDSCVDKAWRGRLSKRSVFVSLATQFIEHFSAVDDYMWGLPNEQAFGVGTRIIGYKPVHCPMPTLAVDAEPAWVDGLAARAGDVSVEETRDWAAVAALFEAHRDAVPLGIWKDEPYLRWRYAAGHYRVLLARRGAEVAGALVYRLGWMGQPLAPLVDWIGPGGDVGAVAALLAEAARTALAAGGRRLESWATPAMPVFATLQSLDMKREDSRFNLCIMDFSDAFDLPWATANWWVSMGDSDIF